MIHRSYVALAAFVTTASPSVSLTNTLIVRRDLGFAQDVVRHDGYRLIPPVSNWDEESYFEIAVRVSFKTM